MNRKPNTKSQSSAAAALSAGMLMASGAPATAQATKPVPPGQKLSAAPQGVPMAMPPGHPGVASRTAAPPYIKFAATFDKWRGTLTTAGMLNGRPVFKTVQGEFFQVDPQTGNLKFHTASSLGYLKLDDWERKAPAKSGGFIKLKGEQRVSVLGVDAQGNVLQQNLRGEKFYLNAMGDMVFVK